MTPPTTMELPETLESEEAINHSSTNGHVATDPLVPETTLDEVGKELAGQSGGELPAQDAEVPAQDDTAPEAPTTKPAKKTAEEKAADKATKHYEKRKRDAEESLSNAVLRRREAEAAVKAAKSFEKAAAELLEEVLARGVERLPLIDAAEARAEARESAASDPDAVGLSPDQNAPAGPLKVHDPDAWKQVSISELGLHPSLTEKLASDGMDTIGRLEQRRADISQGKEKWPKGIGKAKVTQIEDAVIGWLTENQHVAGQVAEEPTEEQLDQLLVDRAKALYTGDPDCLEPAGETDAVWDSGVAAFERGLKLTDCPYVAGEEQDDWLKGWISAKETKDGEIVSSDLGDL